jgi:hypothetical protein
MRKILSNFKRFLLSTPEDPFNVVPTTFMKICDEENPSLKRKRDAQLEWMKSKGIPPP